VIPYLKMRDAGPDGRHHRYDQRLDRAIESVVENRQRWNIRILILTIGVDYSPPPPDWRCIRVQEPKALIGSRPHIGPPGFAHHSHGANRQGIVS
jgi:hypothetical protein